jgi:hypothetical protein
MYRNPVALPVPQENGTLARLRIGHDTLQRAARAAQHRTGFIAMHQHIAVAQLPRHLVGQVPGDSLSPAVPIQNPPVPIHHVDPRIELIEQPFV